MTQRKKNRSHRTSKIVKCTQSYSNGHFPYYCSLFYLARARCMTWRVNFVCSKGAQKQLARTSLTLTVPLSTQEYKWVPASCWGHLTNCEGITCDGLASRPAAGRVEILPAASCYRNRGLAPAAVIQWDPRLHFHQ